MGWSVLEIYGQTKKIFYQKSKIKNAGKYF